MSNIFKSLNKYMTHPITLISIIIIIMGVALFNLWNVLFYKNGLIVSAKELSKIKSHVITSEKIDDYRLSSIEGGKNSISFRYKNINKYGNISDRYAIYNLSKNKVITSIQFDNNKIDLKDATLITYIEEGQFLIIDAIGHIYKYDSENEKTKYISKSNINKNNFFKHTYDASNLYILTRKNQNNDGSPAFNEGELHTIPLNNLKGITNIKLDSQALPISFIYSDKGVNVLYSMPNNLSHQVIEFSANEFDIKNIIPEISKNETNYQLLDLHQISYYNIKDKTHNKISDEFFKLDTSKHLYNRLQNRGLNSIGDIHNMPLFEIDSKIYYTNDTLNKIIAGTNFRDAKPSNIKIGNKILNVETEAKSYISKKYITFVQSEDGFYGIDKKGTPHILSKHSMNFVYKNNLIGIDTTGIYFKKI